MIVSPTTPTLSDSPSPIAASTSGVHASSQGEQAAEQQAGVGSPVLEELPPEVEVVLEVDSGGSPLPLLLLSSVPDVCAVPSDTLPELVEVVLDVASSSGTHVPASPEGARSP